MRPYWSSAIRARSPARRAVSSSSRAFSSISLTLCEPCSRGLLGAPDLLEVGVLALELLDRRLDPAEALTRRLVALLRERLALDLELDESSPAPVHLLGHGVDLHANAARRLVHEVDGLVGELASGNVAVREGGGGDEGRIGDVHAMVDLVALLETAQDRDRVLDPGLVDDDGLKAPLEGRVLLHVLAVLVEGGRPDAVQLAARERGLEHVAGVHGAFRPPRPHHRVQLVDEEDHPALLLGEVAEERLHPFLELAAKLRARDHRAEVEGEDPGAP